MEDTVLVGCVNVEWLNSQSQTMKKVQYKNGSCSLVRNGIKELFLEISQERPTKLMTTKLRLKDINVFKKFMNEGKASIKFNAEKVNVQFTNCPPGNLIFFLKTLFIKLTKDSEANKGVSKEELHKKLRTHLLSEKSGQFDEISPVTNAELDRAKKAAISKGSVTTPSPPASKKRRLIDDKMSENPRAAKKLYAPSPLSIKHTNKSESNVVQNPDDPAMMAALNEEQTQILKGKTAALNQSPTLNITLQLVSVAKASSSPAQPVLESRSSCAKSSQHYLLMELSSLPRPALLLASLVESPCTHLLGLELATTV